MEETLPSLDCKVEHIFISRGHNYIGHHGKPPGCNQIIEVKKIECVAGRGLTGDRFFDYKENYKGQITFFEMEIFEKLCNELNASGKVPSDLRRNVLTRGVDLNQWIGKQFSLQGIKFEGVEECRPCYWMNQSFGPGAEFALRNQGGLRARILSTGSLRVTP